MHRHPTAPAAAALAAALCLSLAAPPPAGAESIDQPPEPKAERGPTGWFRVDTDALSTQLWFGATHPAGPIDIASNIYVVGSFAELDVGVTVELGPLSLTPMVGAGFDFAESALTTLVAPQLFTILDLPSVYAESWMQLFLSSPLASGGEDLGYLRAFALYKLHEWVALGPQAEVSYQFGEMSGVTSLPIGGQVGVGYGKNNTLGIFLGYDPKAPSESDRIAGRFTFIRTWE
jgi:hypothetical protein